ncbi:YihY family inner membrane protein [Caldimonas tepidiphila]|uniref:YihY family inner membrane protein n=1 Tax=Caldimonas tepidiphila TaxID=2315841 RepID=UPI000E5ACC7A|nr:YihY family inner membrane protein [Caldimonas tepidiphila]
MIPTLGPSPARRGRLALLLHTLRSWPWRETLRTLQQRVREDRLGLSASSLTFTTLIALVPLFTVTLAVFTAFPIFSSFQLALERYFVQSLVPDAIAQPVLRYLTQFAAKANRLGVVGLVALLASALALMLTIDRTLNAIWRVRKPRPLAQRLLVYWAALTLGPLLLGMSLTLTSRVLGPQGVAAYLPGSLAMLLNALEFLLLALAFAALFRCVPNTDVRWTHALAGGVFVSVGLEAAKRLLAWYLGQVPTYSAIYGAFATVPIFLIWIHASWLIVLLGAVLAAHAPSLQMGVVRGPAVAGQRFHIALALLRELHAAQQGEARGLDALELAARLRTDPLLIEPVLEALEAMDWVGRLDEAGGARHVLLVDLQRQAAAPLVARLLIAPEPPVPALWRPGELQCLSAADLLGETVAVPPLSRAA